MLIFSLKNMSPKVSEGEKGGQSLGNIFLLRKRCFYEDTDREHIKTHEKTFKDANVLCLLRSQKKFFKEYL